MNLLPSEACREQCSQAFSPWLPVETDSFNRAKEAPAHRGTRVLTTHRRRETYFTVKTQERIPWELAGRRTARVGFPEREEKLLGPVFVCRGPDRGWGRERSELY